MTWTIWLLWPVIACRGFAVGAMATGVVVVLAASLCSLP
jgi:hypothetical protein